MRETIDQKARRLVDADRVAELPSTVYGVQGDHGAYVVVYLPLKFCDDWWKCDCPAEGECSHIRAAKLKAAT